MGCTLDHRPGHTITLRREHSSHSKAGGGHWLLAIGRGAPGSQNVASCEVGPDCLRTLHGESRSALQTHPAVRATLEALRMTASQQDSSLSGGCLSRPDICRLGTTGSRYQFLWEVPVSFDPVYVCSGLQQRHVKPAALRKVASVQSHNKTSSKAVKRPTDIRRHGTTPSPC